MTKDDVKRMLRVCIDPECDRGDCYEQCKYFDNICCLDYLCRDALTIIEEQESEIDQLKADYSNLQEQFAQYQMASDKEIMAQRKQAQIDVLNKVKEEVYPFLQAEMYNKKRFIIGDHISDKLLENQNIGIIKAQDVLSKWFKVKIDELIKEVENGEDNC